MGGGGVGGCDDKGLYINNVSIRGGSVGVKKILTFANNGARGGQ